MEGASLNELAEILAERAGRQYDTTFIQEMKPVINYWRSKLLRDTLNANKDERVHFRQYIEVALERVNTSDLPGFPNMPVLRTVCPLPVPVRANGMVFDFVGSADKISAMQLLKDQHEVKAALNARNTGNRPKALWLNKYIYVWNTLSLPALGISAVWNDPTQVQDFTCNCGKDKCFDDDMPYPVSSDIQQRIIQSILATELRTEHKIDTPTVKVDAPDQA